MTLPTTTSSAAPSDAPPRRQRPGPAIIVGAVAAFWAIGLVVMVALRLPGASPTAEADTYAGLRILPFTLTNHDGRSIDTTIFDGRVTVLSFFFASCPLVCPRLATDIASLQPRLADTPVQFLSISVDGQRDTPEVIRQFALRHGGTLDTWTLATGDPTLVASLVRDGLSLFLDAEDSQQVPAVGGGTMANIVHPDQLILIGPDRSVRGLYLSTEPTELDRLEADARRLARTVSSGS